MSEEFRNHIVPGFRIIKTSLAVLICLTFFDLINYENPIYASIACILTMRTTVTETTQSGFDRIIGTILGGVISLLILVLPLDNVYQPLVLSLAVLIDMMVSKWFNFRASVFSMSGVIILITLLSHGSSSQTAITYVSVRVAETMVGITIALLINRFVNPVIEKEN
ncbi:MAG: hypothetical protein GX775_03160 [Erysipelothrix sp.]|nr:hypothetical protein [Erysipelothrix sp.]